LLSETDGVPVVEAAGLFSSDPPLVTSHASGSRMCGVTAVGSIKFWANHGSGRNPG